MRAHRVRALLMGGQACVLYGAAEFSRDTDLLRKLHLTEETLISLIPAETVESRIDLDE